MYKENTQLLEFTFVNLDNSENENLKTELECKGEFEDMKAEEKISEVYINIRYLLIFQIKLNILLSLEVSCTKTL